MQKTQILPQRNTPSHKLARKYSHYNISFLYFLPHIFLKTISFDDFYIFEKPENKSAQTTIVTDFYV